MQDFVTSIVVGMPLASFFGRQGIWFYVEAML